MSETDNDGMVLENEKSARVNGQRVPDTKTQWQFQAGAWHRVDGGQAICGENMPPGNSYERIALGEPMCHRCVCL